MSDLQTHLDGVKFEMKLLQELCQLDPDDAVVMRTQLAAANLQEHIKWLVAWMEADFALQRYMK